MALLSVAYKSFWWPGPPPLFLRINYLQLPLRKDTPNVLLSYDLAVFPAQADRLKVAGGFSNLFAALIR
jgi:hypothetical protein